MWAIISRTDHAVKPLKSIYDAAAVLLTV